MAPATQGAQPVGATSPRSYRAVAASRLESALVPAWGLNRVFSFLEVVLGDRRRMIQMGVIGMCIGLYILMRK
jgi:hypothetical protein